MLLEKGVRLYLVLLSLDDSKKCFRNKLGTRMVEYLQDANFFLFLVPFECNFAFLILFSGTASVGYCDDRKNVRDLAYVHGTRWGALQWIQCPFHWRVQYTMPLPSTGSPFLK